MSVVRVKSSAVLAVVLQFTLHTQVVSASPTPLTTPAAETTPAAAKAISTASAPAGWTEAIRDDDIVVYKRTRAGSPYEEVRAETKFNAKPDDFIPFFNEPPNYKKWVYGAMESRLVSRAAEFDLVFYGVFKIPWPFENRELFSRVQITRDEKNRQLTARLNDISSTQPTAAGLVRVSKFESLWSVRAAGENQVDFSIEMYAEPGGKLPPFIVNLVLSRIQLWSIKNLRRELSRSKN